MEGELQVAVADERLRGEMHFGMTRKRKSFRETQRADYWHVIENKMEAAASASITRRQS
jgi:hypothetical protein